MKFSFRMEAKSGLVDLLKKVEKTAKLEDGVSQALQTKHADLRRHMIGQISKINKFVCDSHIEKVSTVGEFLNAQQIVDTLDALKPLLDEAAKLTPEVKSSTRPTSGTISSRAGFSASSSFFVVDQQSEDRTSTRSRLDSTQSSSSVQVLTTTEEESEGEVLNQSVVNVANDQSTIEVETPQTQIEMPITKAEDTQVTETENEPEIVFTEPEKPKTTSNLAPQFPKKVIDNMTPSSSTISSNSSKTIEVTLKSEEAKPTEKELSKLCQKYTTAKLSESDTSGDCSESEILDEPRRVKPPHRLGGSGFDKQLSDLSSTHLSSTGVTSSAVGSSGAKQQSRCEERNQILKLEQAGVTCWSTGIRDLLCDY